VLLATLALTSSRLRLLCCSCSFSTEGGRSGSFFYFSEDGKYIVKTMTEAEATFLVKWMPRYVEYMSKNRNSLVSRFCGFHSLRLYNLTIHFMVMQSVFQTTRKIHERYDLKGSFVDRHADTKSGKKAAHNQNANGLRAGGFKNVVYKDNDLNRTVRLSEKDRLLFLHQIRKDAYFLRDCNIMDYSLLLGVHHTSHVVPLMSPISPSSERGSKADQIPLSPSSRSPSILSQVTARNSGALPPVNVFTKDDGGVQASIIEGPGIYFFGLIDILQEYNTTKKLERYVPSRVAELLVRCEGSLLTFFFLFCLFLLASSVSPRSTSVARTVRASAAWLRLGTPSVSFASCRT
jgi:1-phosphatidylinositol-4-phosphate 5-kinase